MIIKNLSNPRAISLKSAPSKSRNVQELPSIFNNSTRSIIETKSSMKSKLERSNRIIHKKNLSMEAEYSPRLEIEALNGLCNQLLQGQEELKKRIEKQEILIESLTTESKLRNSRQKPIICKKIETAPRIAGHMPRGSEESGFFTFRPSETNNSKFPRELFSRKTRSKPQ